MTTSEICQRYLDFFKEPPRNHAAIPSAPLVPENDSTTLFTGSGMQPLLPYLLGQRHRAGKRLVDSQKSFRAEDIDEVGDNRHTTFFEMLGNWSFGDYWKKEQLGWFFEFLTDTEKGAGLDPARLYVTVFAGDAETGIPADEESKEIWKKLFAEKNVDGGDAKYVELGSEKEGSEKGMQGGRIFSYDVKKNWWSRAGVPSKMPAGEPGGPDSEVFYEFDSIKHDEKFGKFCHPNCDCGRFLEIGNSVFMEYKKREDGTFEKLAQRNVDFGGGLERITAAANDDPDVFNIDIFEENKNTLEKSSGRLYKNCEREFRIILDHVRAAVFLLADGVMPSNTERGYVLRRLLRRAIRFADKIGAAQNLRVTNVAQEFILDRSLIVDVAETFRKVYASAYNLNLNEIVPQIEKEEAQFRKTLMHGLREFDRFTKQGTLSAQDAFQLVTTYGFPYEVILEEATEKKIEKIDTDGFEELFKKHQELSRTSSAGMFKGGLADHAEKTIKLHTAHHLLLKALQMVLGPQVKQRGSNITSERLRLDFSYDGKMTDEQKHEVEKIVNEKISDDLPVIRSEMAREDAEKLGAEHEFGQKYPEHVSVYSIGPKSVTPAEPQFDQAFSIEFCGGPHVARTGEIGHFKLIKEEAVAAGIRRVRGTIE